MCDLCVCTYLLESARPADDRVLERQATLAQDVLEAHGDLATESSRKMLVLSRQRRGSALELRGGLVIALLIALVGITSHCVGG